MRCTVTELELPGVERPLTVPERGAKTAQAVLELIRLYPELHDQTEWVMTPEIAARYQSNKCGTTLCVAGWTQWLHEGRVTEDDADDRAAAYLELDHHNADALFYSNDEHAVRALEYVARGEQIDWDAVRS